MGTRGLFGFYYKGNYYLFYNHFDSYTEGLGRDLINEIKTAISENRLDEWKDKILMLKKVSEDDHPTDDDINKLKEFTDLRVSNQSTSDWYCLLRKCQGSYEKCLSSGYYLDSNYNETYLTGDIFIEYSYILNFDTNKFECYSSNNEIGKYDFNSLPNF